MSEHALSPVPGDTPATASPTQLRQRIDEVFSPSAPCARRDLFAGRHHQVQDLLQVVLQRGQHAVVHGERGVGKTSLVQLLADFFQGPLVAVRVAADPADGFASLWRRVAAEFRFTEQRPTSGFVPGSRVAPFNGASLLASAESGGEALTPGRVVDVLRQLAMQDRVVVVIDEFDRITDAHARTLVADTLKGLSDLGVPVTVVLVGVGDSVDELLAAHPSVGRALVAIPMPRMSETELLEACTRMVAAAGFLAEDAVIERIVTLAQGLPHVVHLLGQGAARAAAAEGGDRLTLAHLDAAVQTALRRAAPAVEQAYEQAIVRARRGIYPEILLACALTPRDARGMFAVDDVRGTLERIVGREVRGLTNQVAALTESGRGAVLQKHGTGRTARYRFVDPSLQPYILMRGLERGWATQQTPAWLPAVAADTAPGERRAA